MSFPRYPRYKPSGVAWLGEVPEHWDVCALKRRFRIVGGATPDSNVPEYWDGDIPWATPADLGKTSTWWIESTGRSISGAGLESCAASLIPAGSLVLSTRAPIGSIGLAARALCTNQGCKGLVPDAGNCSTFYAYVLTAAVAELVSRGKGTTFVELSADALGALPVPQVELGEQRAIARALDRECQRLDLLVEEQRRLLRALLEKRQAVISHAVTKGLNPDAPLRVSGLDWPSMIPAHWELKRLKRLGRLLVGLTYEPNDVVADGAGTVVLRASNVQDGQLDFDDCVQVKRAIPDELRTRTGDILICSRSGSRSLIGKNAKIDSRAAGMTFGAFMTVLRADEHDYLSSVLSSALFESQSGAYLTSTINQLTLEVLGNLAVPWPPEVERREIANIVGATTAELGRLAEQARRSIELLEERRSALITAAVTGQIDVRGLVPQEAVS